MPFSLIFPASSRKSEVLVCRHIGENFADGLLSLVSFCGTVAAIVGVKQYRPISLMDEGP
jgi:hypothetical protein